MEEQGRYNEKQLSLSQFKFEVAQRHSVGPYINKKKKTKKDDGNTELGQTSQSSADMNITKKDEYDPGKCPIKSQDPAITQEDIATVLWRQPISGSYGHNSVLVKSALMTQLGLNSLKGSRIGSSSSSNHGSSSSSGGASSKKKLSSSSSKAKKVSSSASLSKLSSSQSLVNSAATSMTSLGASLASSENLTHTRDAGVVHPDTADIAPNTNTTEAYVPGSSQTALSNPSVANADQEFTTSLSAPPLQSVNGPDLGITRMSPGSTAPVAPIIATDVTTTSHTYEVGSKMNNEL